MVQREAGFRFCNDICLQSLTILITFMPPADPDPAPDRRDTKTEKNGITRKEG